MKKKRVASNKFLEKWLWSKMGRRFASRFNLINFAHYKWPIRVRFDYKGCVYHVRGRDKTSMYVGRPERIEKYNNGVAKRLQRIGNEYLVGNVEFHAGDIVIDIGANVGELTKYLQNTFNVRAVAVEPDETEFECLKLNVDSKRSWVFSQPLWREVTRMSFYDANGTGDSSLFEPPESTSCVAKKTITLDKLLASIGLQEERIRFLKLEAEGAEPEILEGAAHTLGNIDYIAADVGPERGVAEDYTLAEVTALLTKNDFRLLSCGTRRLVLLFENTRMKQV